MSRAALRRIFRTRRERESLANANPHRLRHTFGADMIRAGVRLSVLQKMMGHEHPKTTLQYVNVAFTDIQDEFNRAVERVRARYEDRGA